MLADRWDRIHDCIGTPGIPSKVEGRLNKEGPDEKRVGARRRVLYSEAKARETVPSTLIWKNKTPPDEISGGVGLKFGFWESDPSPQPRAPLHARQGLRRRDPDAKSGKLKRQAILAVGLNDRALPAGLGDGQLSGALGTFCQVHDLVAQLGIAHLLADARQGLRDVRLFYFAPGGSSSGGRLAGRGKPPS